MKVSFLGLQVNALYLNDGHGKLETLPRLATAIDEFKKSSKSHPTLILGGGDLNLGANIEDNSFVNRFFSKIGMDASSMGNHEMEAGDDFQKVIRKVKFPWLAANALFSKEVPLKDTIKSSVTINKNGEKFGIIGLTVIDYNEESKRNKKNYYLDTAPFNQVITTLKNEVKNFEEQGVNKIFLLAHTGKQSKDGLDYYKEFAKIGGIDVIIGGHDHLQADEWLKSDRNEPVKIVATGKAKGNNFNSDFNMFGELKLYFDDNGVLVPDKTTNIFKNTSDFKPYGFVESLIKKHNLKHRNIVAQIPEPIAGGKILTKENPAASLLADASLWYVNKNTTGKKADFSLAIPGSARAGFDDTQVCSLTLKKVYPFITNNCVKTTLTKQQVMNILQHGINSIQQEKIVPGVVQVGGLKYHVDKDLKVTDVYLLDENGKIKENIALAPPYKTYTVVYSDFLITGTVGLTDLKKDINEVEYFERNQQEIVLEYLQSKPPAEKLTFKEPRIVFL